MEEKLVISAIEPQKKHKDRYNIYADGEYTASLGAQALVMFGIREGAAIEAGTLQKAVLQDNVQYAFDSAVAMLARKMRTRSEIVQRLSTRGISDEAIEAAVEKLSSYGYVDDAAYAVEYVQSMMASGRWGRRAVKYRLAEKGIENSAIDQAMLVYTEEDEKTAAARQAQALFTQHANADKRKQKQKVYAALMRHGFDYGIITALLAEDLY